MKTNFNYLDSLREEVSHGYHEANQIIAQAKLNYTYLKAPNGRPSKLCLEDWILVRTRAFKEKFGDWETAYKKRFLRYHEAVKQLSGNEFEKQPNMSIIEQVGAYFDLMGNIGLSPLYGEVILDRKGIGDSLAHGLGRNKAIAFAAVKEVIENGILIDYHKNHKGRGYDSAVIAAPIIILDERFICYVIIIRSKIANRFYLHEVWTEKSLTSVRSSAAQKQPSHLQGTAKVLQDIVCASTLPENFFDENGEPCLDGCE